MNDRDLELIARSGIPVSAIIEKINNGIDICIDGDKFIEIDGDFVICSIQDRKLRAQKGYVISALTEFEKTASTLRLRAELERSKSNTHGKAYFHYHRSEESLSEEIAMLRDSYRGPPNHFDQKNDLPIEKFNCVEANESQPEDIGIGGESNVRLPYKSLLYCLILLAIACFASIGFLYAFIVPLTIIQVVIVSISLYIYMRKSLDEDENKGTLKYIPQRLSPRQALFVVPVLIPLLVASISYSIVKHRVSRELDVNGATAIATVSKVDQHERANNKIDRIQMDFSFTDMNGRIIEASRSFPGSNIQYLKCLNKSLIKVKYSPDNPDIFEVVLPCIDGGP